MPLAVGLIVAGLIAVLLDLFLLFVGLGLLFWIGLALLIAGAIMLVMNKTGRGRRRRSTL